MVRPAPEIAPLALTSQQLHHRCEPGQFQFETTQELAGLTELIGQTRAMDAVRFGAGVQHDGYNMFVLGSAGMGKRSLVKAFLEKKAGGENEPSDWCYLNNFTQPHKPHAVRLPCGRGAELSRQMARWVDYLRAAIPALFESDDYRAKVGVIEETFSKQQERVFKELGEDAEKQNIVLLRTPGGFAFAPTRNQEVLAPDDYNKLDEEEKKRISTAIAELQQRLEKILNQIPQGMKERSEQVAQLNGETTRATVQHVMEDLHRAFDDLSLIQKYLDAVQHDIIEHADDFRHPEETTKVSGLTLTARESFHRYQVNLLVTNGKQAGAALVSEDNPTYSNLVGRVEHIAQLGALVTDFTLIQPGALHRANGGYLLLDVRKVLLQPFAWDALKRALQSREIRIESLGQMFSLVSTVSLEPEPIPLSVKIVLFGDRLMYYLLQQYDPDFSELFKVAADFEDRIERTPETHLLYARLIGTLATKDKLLAFDRSAVARVIEYSARLVGDAQRLSIHMRSVADLLQEADYWAREAAQGVVTAGHVQQAIDTQIHRQDRVRGQLHESILRGTQLIDTQGSVAGQINGLSVLALGDFAFAQPIRITATTRFGEGEMVNIEREVKLSGAIHSKGVLILSAYLAAHYARNQPLALSASLVFEQSYGPIDGDSASLAELCVLLSNLANAPVKQSLAVTGSVNQLGQVQAIGGVNEKIEGFFDICAARGLSGEQGVLIPGANVKHLMLRCDVVSAAEAGQFHIYAVDHADQAMALLTGVAAGEAGADGSYPAGTINQRVAARVLELSELRKRFARQPDTRAQSDKEPV